MNKNYNFENRMQALINLLKDAQGDRSLREYAEASGISASNLSRIMNSKTVKMPSRKMLEKLASENAAPQNGITLEDLLIAAGYQTEYISDIDEQVESPDNTNKLDVDVSNNANFKINQLVRLNSYSSSLSYYDSKNSTNYRNSYNYYKYFVLHIHLHNYYYYYNYYKY